MIYSDESSYSLQLAFRAQTFRIDAAQNLMVLVQSLCVITCHAHSRTVCLTVS